jgi:hypothetical protein
MVTIAWNPLGFHGVAALPKCTIFNATYYHGNILEAGIQFLPEPGGR